MSEPAPMLNIQQLRAGYGPADVLKQVSLTVFPGEIVTLVGANGAGKSTVLMTISGIVRARGGQIIFQGQDITHAGTQAIAAAGLVQVPEGRQVFPRMTVAENLDMGAYLRRDRAGIAEDLERMFTLFPILRERARQAAGTLSGGEQQMLAIARALMGRPRLLLLDEPSLGLAPLVVARIFDVVRDLNATEGLTVLLVEQNARAALTLAHRGYVLETGRMVLSGPGRDLLNDPAVRAAYLGE